MKIEDMDNIQLAESIDRYVRGELPRKILKRRLIDEICYEPLAEEFGYSLPQIKRIVYKAQSQLFKHLD